MERYFGGVQPAINRLGSLCSWKNGRMLDGYLSLWRLTIKACFARASVGDSRRGLEMGC